MIFELFEIIQIDFEVSLAIVSSWNTLLPDLKAYIQKISEIWD